jgi:hypothetical protein
LLMTVVSLLEGMQISFFAVARIPKSERGDATRLVERNKIK